MDATMAIVGTAGRKEDGKILTNNHFSAMYSCAEKLLGVLNDDCGYGITMLVSGGAAWADHVAVRLFLDKKIEKLLLWFPAPFNPDTCRFEDLPNQKSQYPPGATANYYHDKFMRKTNITSLREIARAIQAGAVVNVGRGFYARNAMVAQSDVILAMTFGNGAIVKDGGTSHTVHTYLRRVANYHFFDKSFHYDLNSGEIHAGAKVLVEEIDSKENS